MNFHQQLRLGGAKFLTILGIVITLNCINANLARAEPKFFNVILSSDTTQTFTALRQQAEASASKLIQQGFAQKPRVTEVVVTVVGERNGQQVPLLYAKVSRSDWQADPKLDFWTKYYSNSAVLLGFSKTQSYQATTSRNGTVAVSSNKRAIEDDPAYRDD